MIKNYVILNLNFFHKTKNGTLSEDTNDSKVIEKNI